MPTDRVVSQLQDERKRLADELKRLDQAIDLLTKGKGPMGASSGRRQMSEEGRAKVREAQRLRWERHRAEKAAQETDQQMEQATAAAVSTKRGRKKK